MTNEQIIWNFFKSKGLNDYAIAGLMGNIMAESGLKSTNMQNSYEEKLGMDDDSYTKAVDDGSYTNFVNDKVGYGLVQWTFWTRKQGLLDYAKSKGVSIGDMTMQLEHVWNELQGYTAIMNVMKTAKTVREVSDIVLFKFEAPADMSEKVQEFRASLGNDFYIRNKTEVSKVTNYKQTDSRWASNPYPIGSATMANSGCGATAVADLLDKSPVEIANWMMSHGGYEYGYVSTNSGTYHDGITACIRAYGYNAAQITSSSRAGRMTDSTFEIFKASIQSGNCGILLMGGLRTGCRNSYWSNAGHYIAVVGYSNGQYLVYDPAYHARDGYHPFDDFAGNIKHIFTTTVKWNKSTVAETPKASTGSTTTTSTVTATQSTSTSYTFAVKEIKGGSQGVNVLLAQEILKARGIYKGSLDRSYGNQTIAAVKAYQKARKMTQDGVITAKVWNDMLALPKSGTKYKLKQIKLGSTGNEVLLLQEILKARGYYTGKLDKSFGSATEKALRKYQTDRKGSAGQVDGVAGKKVWKDLIAL